MTEDNLLTRPKFPEIGGHVLDTFGHSFGKITSVHSDSDEVVIKTNKGTFVTISNVSIYYEGGGKYMLTDDIEVEDPVSPEPTLAGLDATLAERGSRYGAFNTHAEITQALKFVMYGNLCNNDKLIVTNWGNLRPSQKEALEMIAHKIGRILNGDPNYADSWVDIAGYAQLVVNELENN